MKSNLRITIDTELYPSVNVHIHNITRMIFKEYEADLYYFDTTNKAFTKDQTIDYPFLNIIEIKKSFFSDKK